MIEVENVGYRYPGARNRALSGVTLNLTKRRVAIVGANGSGKTTLLKCIAGLAPPSSGTIRVDGIPVCEDNQLEIMRRVWYCPQVADEQLSAMSVYSEVGLPLSFSHMASQQQGVVIRQALNRIGIGSLEKRFVGSLSPGEKKKVVLARSLVAELSTLLVDEPTANLDPRSSREILEILDSFSSEGVAVVVATNLLPEACAWAEEVVILENGTVAATGAPSLLSDERVLLEAGLR
jgi:energy-coupling factor transporter ATP-binding protein EcfA2